MTTDGALPPAMPAEAPEQLHRVYQAALAITATYPMVIDGRAALMDGLYRAGESFDERWVHVCVPGLPEQFAWVSHSTGAARSSANPPPDVPAEEIASLELPASRPASQAFMEAWQAISGDQPAYRPWLDRVAAAAQLVFRGGGDLLLPELREAIATGDLDGAEARIAAHLRELSAFGGDAGALAAAITLSRGSSEGAEAVRLAVRQAPHSPAALQAACETLLGFGRGAEAIREAMDACAEAGRRWMDAALNAATDFEYGAAMREACRWLWAARGLGGEGVRGEAGEPERRAAKVAEESAVRVQDAIWQWFARAVGSPHAFDLAAARRMIDARASSPREARRLAREMIEWKRLFRRAQLDDLTAP